MRLGQTANEEIGRLLNGTNTPEHGAIGHLASAAGRAAESLIYLAEIDDLRFKERSGLSMDTRTTSLTMGTFAGPLQGR